MSADPVERLRARVNVVVVEAIVEALAFAKGQGEEPDSEEVTARILAAIVEELGVTEAHVELLEAMCSAANVRLNGADDFEVRDALSTLLRASRHD